MSSVKCDGGLPNSFSNLLYRGPVLTQPNAWEYVAQWFQLTNLSGGALSMGAGVRFPLTWWRAGQWVNATPLFTDDTTDAQDVGADDFPLETTTANDGFVVVADRPFNLLCLLVGVASTVGTPVRVVKLSNGSGWGTALTGADLYQGPITSAHWTTGEHLIWWDISPDWVVTTGHANEGGLPVGKYAALIQSTTPPTTTAGAATSLSVHHLPFAQKAVADGGIFTLGPSDKGLSLGSGEGISVAFTVADPQNSIRASVRARG